MEFHRLVHHDRLISPNPPRGLAGRLRPPRGRGALHRGGAARRAGAREASADRGARARESVLTRATKWIYADAAIQQPANTSAMAPSTSELPTRYAASFCVGFSAPAAGALVVEESRLLLEGRSAQGHVELSIPYFDVSEVRVGRLPEERLNGHSALLLSRRDGDLVRVEPVGFGLLNELAELIAALANEHADPTEQVSVILPIRKGRLAQARELVEQGPPFDPAVLGLTRHEVFVTDEEAIFVFEGRNVRRKLERLTRDPTLWQAGLAWRSCVGGRPHLSTEVLHPISSPVFSWTANGSLTQA
jgi:hypothetical protein